MTDKYIGIQLKYSGGIPNPIIASAANAGAKRWTLQNVVKLIWGAMHGSLSGGNAYIMVQDTLVAASATATCASVVNGNTVTIAGTALTAAQRRATGTLTCATAIAGDTVVINGVTFTGVSGAAVPGEATFSVDTGDAETATSIAAQVNAYASPLISGVLAAKSAAAVVTIYAVTQGTAGNAITLATTGGTITRSAATLANGAALTNNTFDFAGTNDTTAAALAYAINNSTTAAIKRVTATAASNVVTITAKVAGPAGNAITLTSVGGTITVTGSGFLASGTAGEPVQWAL
jgi:hypothetical protein